MFPEGTGMASFRAMQSGSPAAYAWCECTGISLPLPTKLPAVSDATRPITRIHAEIVPRNFRMDALLRSAATQKVSYRMPLK